MASIQVAVASDHTPSNFPMFSGTPEVIRDVWIHDNMITNAPQAGLFAANVSGSGDIGILIENNHFGSWALQPVGDGFYPYAVVVDTCGHGTITADNTFGSDGNHILRINSPNVGGLP
jgi:hypothetical protein